MNRVRRAVTATITSLKLKEHARNRRVAVSAVVTGDVIIGDYTYVGGRTEMRGTLTPITVGRYCSIGRDVKVFSSGQAHLFSGLSTYPFFVLDASLDRTKFNAVSGPTTIGDDVWIGSNAIIMPGVAIGTGAVIGAGSIVTRDVAPFSVVVGAPHRVIGERFDEATARAVLASRWWELDFEQARAKFPRLIDENCPVTPESLR